MQEIVSLPHYEFAKLVFTRLIGVVYFLNFLMILRNFPILFSNEGLLPADRFFKKHSFWMYPSIFQISCTRSAYIGGALSGLVLSVFAVTDLTSVYGYWSHCVIFGCLWYLHLSFMLSSQTEFTTGPELLLSEVGFLTLFLGPSGVSPHPYTIFFFKLTLFQTMFASGIVKIFGDDRWRNLKAMERFYELVAVPSRLAWAMHQLPRTFHRVSTFLVLVLELVLPFFYFAFPYCYAAAGITIAFQIAIFLMANFSFFNLLTASVSLFCFDDGFVSHFFSVPSPTGRTFPEGVAAAMAAVLSFASFWPMVYHLKIAANFFNVKFWLPANPLSPFHLRNYFGVYGRFAHSRKSVVIEGWFVNSDGSKEWKGYKVKSWVTDETDLPIFSGAPYFNLSGRFFNFNHDLVKESSLFFILEKILKGEKSIRSIFKDCPREVPAKVRVRVYRFVFARAGDKKGRWFRRTVVGELVAPCSLVDLRKKVSQAA